MKPVTRVYLTDDQGEKVFGEGPCRLLRGVRETGSLRASAAQMGMAYTKALRIVQRAEAALGVSLTARAIGGKDGGGSRLTAQGEAVLLRYEAYRDACDAQNRAAFSALFAGGEPRYGCVIMASGLGRRFGGNKLMADFGGVPMIERALLATDEGFMSRAVITRHADVYALCKARGVRAVLHDLPDRSDTVRLGLGAVMEGTTGCLFCPGDQPLLSGESIGAMLQAAKENPQAIVRLCDDTRVGAPVLFPAWAYDALLHLQKGQGGSAVVRAHAQRVVTVRAKSAGELDDVDDLKALERLLSALRSLQAGGNPL